MAHRGHPPPNSIVIVIIVIIVIIVVENENAIPGYTQEARAGQAVAALQNLTVVTAGVLRDGDVFRVPARDVVPGDVVVLSEGDTVAADARLLSAANLMVAEASLTGEGEPVLKHAATLSGLAPLSDGLDMVFSGTAATQGAGRAVVTGTGMDTHFGEIAALLAAIEDPPTPLQREIARVGRTLGIAVVAIAGVVMATVVLTSNVHHTADAVTVLLGVSLAVAVVPDGSP